MLLVRLKDSHDLRHTAAIFGVPFICTGNRYVATVQMFEDVRFFLKLFDFLGIHSDRKEANDDL